MCYVVTDIEEAGRQCRADKMIVVQRPVQAVAFPPRRIAWLMGDDGIPTELLESDDRMKVNL